MSNEESNLMSSTPLATWAASDSGTIDSPVDQMIIPSTLHETRLARTDLNRNMGAGGHLAGAPPPPQTWTSGISERRIQMSLPIAFRF